MMQMSGLVVAGFDQAQQAGRALNELVRLRKERLIDLEGAVVAVRSQDGAVRIKQSVNLAGFKGKVIRSSLSREQEQRLRAALSQATQEDVIAAASLPLGASPVAAGAT